MAFPKINDYSRFSAKVLKVNDIASETREIIIEKPKDLTHVPGQFIGIAINDGREDAGFRSYSMLLDKDENIQLVIKLVKGGRGSTYLFTLKEGDSVEVLYPLGYFGLPDKLENKLAMIATGTGIVPLLSLLESFPEGSNQTIELIFGVRYEVDLFYQERVEQLAKKLPNFSYKLCVSRMDADKEGVHKGRVSLFVPSEMHTQYFLCGSGDMIKDVTTKLQKDGVVEKNIYFEDFNG
jgi:ferredoxin-NADP reductase